MHTTTDARGNAKKDAHAARLPGFAAQTPGSNAEGETHTLAEAHASSLGSDEGGSHHILVPLDGSRLAAAALPYAVALARAFEAHITLLAVVDPVPEYADWPSVARQEADERHVTESTAYLQAVALPLRAGNLAVTTLIRHGNPANVILTAAQTEDCSLIVMSTHGRTGLERMRMGSVAQHVLRHAIVSTLVVPPGNDGFTGEDVTITGITVPLDGSSLAEAALPMATQIALALSVPLTLFQVIPSIMAQAARWGVDYYPFTEETEHDEEEAVAEYLQMVAIPLRAGGLVVHTVWQRSVTSRAEEIILAYLPPTGIAVMASHGRGGVLRWALGSTAEAVLDCAPCPILIVRAGATAHAWRQDSPALAGQRVE